MPDNFNRQLHPAMLPALLMLTQRGKEMEQSLDNLIGFIQSTKNALEALRNGVETFHAGMMKMVPPETPQLKPSVSPPSSDLTSPTVTPPATEPGTVLEEPLVITTPTLDEKTSITE